MTNPKIQKDAHSVLQSYVRSTTGSSLRSPSSFSPHRAKPHTPAQNAGSAPRAGASSARLADSRGWASDGLRPKKRTNFFHKSSEIRKQVPKIDLWPMSFPRRLALALDFLQNFGSRPHFLSQFGLWPRRGPHLSPKPAPLHTYTFARRPRRYASAWFGQAGPKVCA